MRHDPIRLGHIHDQFCRCRRCKPPLVGDVKMPRIVRFAIIVGSACLFWAAILALVS